MSTIPGSQNHLAELLGISKSICSRHKARGMPTDSVAAAKAWMQSTLDPARRKGIRYDKHYQPPSTPWPAKASELMDIAATALKAGKSITALVPTLRVALSAVPMRERDDVGLDLDVMKVLVADVLALRPADKDALNDDGTRVYLDREMTDAEAQEAGEFWYGVAAGEWVPA